MALSEHRRHRMYRKLEEIMGEEAAGTLIEHLPRATWADLATKGEVRSEIRGAEERIATRLDGRLAKLEALLESRLNSQTRALVLFIGGLMVAVATLAFAAFRLA